MPRIFIAVLLLATILAYPILESRLAGPEAWNNALFHLAYVLTLLSIFFAWFRAAWLVSQMAGALRLAPLTTFAFAVNVLIGSLLVLFAFTQIGVILLMMTGSVAIVWLALGVPLGESRIPTIIEWMRNSLLSFLTIYVLLMFGEVYLRYNPMLVGGGGGGNPALQQLYRGFYTVNSNGFRGAELRPVEGQTRILVIGDSLTFGQGVRDEETYPYQLELLLNTEYPDADYEVLNAGHRGANTHDELDHLRSFGLATNPKLILLQFFLNDLEPRFQDTAKTANDWIRLIVKKPLGFSYVLFFLNYHFDAALKNLSASSKGSHHDWVETLAKGTQAGGEGWTQFDEALRGIREEASSSGIPLVLILYPYPGQLSNPNIGLIHSRVKAHAEELGILVADLIDQFSGLPTSEQRVSEIDHHPSAKMHVLAAKAILQNLRDYNLVR